MFLRVYENRSEVLVSEAMGSIRVCLLCQQQRVWSGSHVISETALPQPKGDLSSGRTDLNEMTMTVLILDRKII